MSRDLFHPFFRETNSFELWGVALDKRVIQTIQFNNVVINIQKNVKSGLSKILFRRIEENFPFWTEKKKKNYEDWICVLSTSNEWNSCFHMSSMDVKKFLIWYRENTAGIQNFLCAPSTKDTIISGVFNIKSLYPGCLISNCGFRGATVQ